MPEYPIELAPGASAEGKIKVAIGGGGGFIGSWYERFFFFAQLTVPSFGLSFPVVPVKEGRKEGRPFLKKECL